MPGSGSACRTIRRPSARSREELARRGVVGVTDATPYGSVGELAPLTAATTDGTISQHVVATGGPALTATAFPEGLQRGPVKLLLADHRLPSLDQVVGWITAAHEVGRPVAIHCVTAAALVLALAAWETAGSVAGDRVEHGAVVPPALRDLLASTPLTVVTQPNFVAERGDEYLADVDVDERPHLYPCAGLLRAGIRVGGSTDAPFGDPDPWRAMAAAVERRARSGTPVGLDEAVSPRRAVELFTTHHTDPGGPARRVAVGEPADLCLLATGMREALDDLSAVEVRATVIEGTVVHRPE